MTLFLVLWFTALTTAQVLLLRWLRKNESKLKYLREAHQQTIRANTNIHCQLYLAAAKTYEQELRIWGLKKYILQMQGHPTAEIPSIHV